MDTATTKDMQLQLATAALRRIERKVGGMTHDPKQGESCDCPLCIARTALTDMTAYLRRDFVK